MSSPQTNQLKENNTPNAEDYLSVEILNKINQFKENPNKKGIDQAENQIDTKLEENNNIENKLEEEKMLHQTQQTQFEMMRHCGLVVDDLNVYDQFDNQQLDSSNASSKTDEEMLPIPSACSPQPRSPNSSQFRLTPKSETGSASVNNNDHENDNENIEDNEMQLNSSHNSVNSGRLSACSNNQLNQLNKLNQLNQLNNLSSQIPTTTGASNVSALLNSNVNSIANSLATSTSPVSTPATQQIANNQNNQNNNALLSEISLLMAAAGGNQKVNLPNLTNNNHNSPTNNNPLANLNGLNLLNNLTANNLPINQIASLLTGNSTNASSLSPQQLLLQQASLGKVSHILS